MPPVLTLRSAKGAALTHNELDDNFVYLDGKIVTFDSAEISRLIDSGIDQLDILDSAMIQRFTLDSSEVIDLVDSAYVQARQLTFDFLDSSEVINLIDSAYVQARVTLRDSSFVTGIVDSGYVTGLIDSHVTNLIDSDYVTNRSAGGNLVTGSGIAGGLNTTPLTHPVGSYMIAKVRRSVAQTYNTGATYPGIFPGDTVAGSNLYYHTGITGSGYPQGIYNSISIGSGTWKALAYVSDTTVEGVIKISGTDYDAAPAVLYQRVA